MVFDRRRRRAKRAIDGGRTSEDRGFREVDGALCPTDAGRAAVLRETALGLVGAACAATPHPALLRNATFSRKGRGTRATSPSSVGFADIFSPRAGRRGRRSPLPRPPRAAGAFAGAGGDEQFAEFVALFVDRGDHQPHRHANIDQRRLGKLQARFDRFRHGVADASS